MKKRIFAVTISIIMMFGIVVPVNADGDDPYGPPGGRSVCCHCDYTCPCDIYPAP